MFILKKGLTIRTTVYNFVAKLVRISELKTFHIFNGLFMVDVDEGVMEYPALRWSLFDECTSLYQLSVTTGRLGSDVREWLNTGGRSVQELIVTKTLQPLGRRARKFQRLGSTAVVNAMYRREHTFRAASRSLFIG